MKMKKLIMSLLLLGVLPINMVAQDDMYFVPSKKQKAKDVYEYGLPRGTYYSGSSRSVDDYNRRVLKGAIPTDSAGNDIIDFSAVRGVYPDSTENTSSADDYKLTRQLSRFDDYTPSQAYWEGYRDGQWMSPWYASRWYSWYDYDPWYWNYPYYYGYYSSWYGWYSPWYYGYYRPWNYGYYGYYSPRWYGGYVRTTPHRGRITTYDSRRDFGRTTSRTNNSRTYNENRSFGSNRNSSSSFGAPRSSSGSFGGGGSIGGGGGTRGGGGGGYSSGGRSFGGRR